MDENELKKMFSSPDPKERVNVINTVIKGNQPNKLEILTWVSQNDPNAQVRSKVRAFVDQMQKEKINITKEEGIERESGTSPDEVLKNGNPQEKIEIIKLIINDNAAISKETLEWCLKSEKDVMVCAALITALGKLGSDEDLNFIRKFLNHSNARVRANAVEAIGFIGSSTTFDLIKPLLEDGDARVRANAAKCLYACDKSSAMKMIEIMLSGNEVNLVKSAVFVLESIEEEDAKKTLSFAKEKLEFLMESENVPEAEEITITISEQKEPPKTPQQKGAHSPKVGNAFSRSKMHLRVIHELIPVLPIPAGKDIIHQFVPAA